MKTISPARLRLVATLLSVLTAGIVAVPSIQAEPIVGLTTTNSLIVFDSATPGTTSAPIPITGIGGEQLLDLDVRPADQAVYALSNAGRLYSINTTTGAATLSASLTGVSLDPNATRFGIDFNPAVDRLRIVSNTGQNLRLTPGSGVTTIDSNLNGADNRAVSVAYTSAAGLFYIDTQGGANLYSTTNPNGGVMALVGALGASTTDVVGFDISFATGIAYATLTSATGVGSSLYQINLNSGAATLIGTIGPAGTTLRGITVRQATVPDQAGSILLLAIACFGLFAAQRTLRLRCRTNA